jgi:hypothetical protein
MVADETGGVSTGDPEDAIFRDLRRMAGREMKPGRSGGDFGGM